MKYFLYSFLKAYGSERTAGVKINELYYSPDCPYKDIGTNTSHRFNYIEDLLQSYQYSFKIYSSHGNYFYESESDTVCTPGIIPSSIDSTSFFVMSQMNLEQHQEKLFDSDFIMIDVLGREYIEHKSGTLLFYIYNNGKVEKKFTP